MCSGGSVTAKLLSRLVGDGDALALTVGSWSQPLLF